MTDETYIVFTALEQVKRQAITTEKAAFDATMAKIEPWSITALLATQVLLFDRNDRRVRSRCPSTKKSCVR